ncbi:protein phosphatase 2C [Tritrichomonas foetus]|uniref:Protein phosphatase 2C n=1 Tax=Tritrichomonas foetus TaxID=1144522 RepID=A0A1J4JLI3_9EUKA|nr:protein phosphatase 2C [Tritrichomonas foetus]|eukprot:OHS99968.1 protein phosphatase 2C [Tritrichomonas foetus]
MGNHESAELKEDQRDLYLVDQGLTKVSFFVPPNHQVKTLYLSGNKFQSLPMDLQNVNIVLLSNNQYNEVPENVINALKSYPSLKRLDLSQNKITKLPFSHPSLQSLILMQNRFTEIPSLQNFPALDYIMVDFNFIKKLLLSSESLYTLSASLNCIETVDPGLNLPALNSLDLSKNRISSLPNLAQCCPTLRTLNLDDNLITEFNCQLPNTLQDISLLSNNISEISENVTNLPNLKTLAISGNKLTHVPKLPPTMGKFIAYQNNIKTIDPQETPMLQLLAFSHNELEEIPETGMKGDTINFDHNLLKEISLKSLPKNLRILDVSFNQIDKLPSELFESNLYKLEAGFNNISEIPNEITNSNLKILNVSHNPIKSLPKMPKGIERVTASYCNISFVDDIFEECNFLKLVDFSGNQLVGFPQVPSITYLYLSQNQLTVFPFIGEHTKVIDVSYNKIEKLPECIKGSDITVLNLSFNEIRAFPRTHEMPLLQYLKVTGNPIKCDFVDITDCKFIDTVDIFNTEIMHVNHKDILRECITSVNNASISNCLHYLNTSKNSGYSELLGFRESMEDSIIVRDDLGLYAVCDGHGGSETATFLAHKFVELFLKHLEFSTQNVISIFKNCEKLLQKQKFSDGSTLCLCYLHYNKLITAHLGDARALIVKDDGKSRELTIDHKPTMRDEFERIHNIYGKVSKDRVDGILAVARSMGDYSIPGVGHEPTICEFSIEQDDKYLVICCDGVFDVLSNDNVSQIASNSNSAFDAAYRIRNTAFAGGSLDNISVIVVNIRNMK